VTDLQLAAGMVALLLAAGVMAWWWPTADPAVLRVPPPRRMEADAIATIERELAVALPPDCATFLRSPRDETPDATTALDDAASIIELTREYRAGAFAGVPAWPAGWVYVGDEADACPYAIDCASGAVLQLHEGDPGQAMRRFATFAAALRDD
jgi:hypothetical protein